MGVAAFALLDGQRNVGSQGEEGAAVTAVSPAVLRQSAPEGAVAISPTPRWSGVALPKDLILRERYTAQALALGELPEGSFTDLRALKEGDLVALPLEAETALVGRVIFSKKLDAYHVSGKLTQGVKGTFSISQHPVHGMAGRILIESSATAFELVQQPGRVLVVKSELSKVQCFGIPKEPEPTGVVSAAARGPMAAVRVPVLDSLPAAAGVLYLDFDGEVVTDPDWNGGQTIFAAAATMGFNGDAISEADIQDVWERVAEDMKPFNITVTTVLSRYTNAAVGNRMRCIMTPTVDAAPGSGGVAYLRSYRARGFSPDIPCWCFNDSNPAIMAMTISHELGHTFGLRHDGTVAGDEYYDGHGTGTRSWGPLMGAPFSRAVLQWSKDSYPGANNPQDDLAIMKAIFEEANGAGNVLIPDEAGGTVATSALLGIQAAVSKRGIIAADTDEDYYSFKTPGGPITLRTVLANEPNLDPLLRIVDSSNVTLAASTMQATTLEATLSTNLTAGTYYVAVSGQGKTAIGTDPGYPRYGSIGGYTLTGTYIPLPELPFIQSQPVASTTLVEGQTLSLSVSVLTNTTVRYQWFKAGAKIPGATSSKLTIKPVRYTNTGDYTVEVKNAVGTVVSEVASVLVDYKPVFTQQPVPQVVATGGSAAFQVTSHGTEPLSYRWEKNGVAIAGNPSATTASLQLTGVDWFSGASYRCVVSNPIGSTPSTAVNLTVTSGPVFVTQPPATGYVAVGKSIKVTTKAVGTSTIKYQWLRGGEVIPGATSATLSVSKASPAALEGVVFTCRATNPEGQTDSAPLMIDVQDPPVITSPVIRKISTSAGASVPLTISSSGTAPLVHQWYQNNRPVPGSNSATLMLDPAYWSQQGSYKCVVSNAVGVATSASFTVTMTSPAVILTQPVDTKVARGGSGTLKVVAGGTPGLRYQWYRNTEIIPGATKASLSLTKASDATEGSYTVSVTNDLSAAPVLSSAATVTVENVPVIVTHPSTHYAAIGSSHSFSVVMDSSSSPMLRYQWYKSKRAIEGATSATLALDALTLTAAGSYHVVITNDVGKATSKAATLYVQTPPSITQEPANLNQYEYAKAVFEVKASGSATLTYQWFKDGMAIPKATGRIYTIPAARLPAEGVVSHEGAYYCEVRNKVGLATSASATLFLQTVPPPTFTSFSPGRGAPGDYVSIIGTNFNWTRQVTFGGVRGSFVVISNTELRAVVPATGRTGLINVITYGGNANSPSNFTVSTGLNNDNFANAKLVFGTAPTVTGNNTGATTEIGEFLEGPGAKTIWYTWQCPATGTYLMDFGKNTTIDWVASCYSGNSLSNLLLIRRARRYSIGFSFFISPSFTMSAVKGARYHIQFQGYSGTPARAIEGPVTFTIKYQPSALATRSGASGVMDGEEAVYLRTAFLAKVGTAESFSWMTQESDIPAFSLDFNPMQRSLRWQWAGAEPGHLEQAIEPNTEYELELVFNKQLLTWGLLLNGHWAIEDGVIPRDVDLSTLQTLEPVWTPHHTTDLPPLMIRRHQVDYPTERGESVPLEEEKLR